MAAPLPTSDLAVHFAGRLVIPSQEGAERIERAAGMGEGPSPRDQADFDRLKAYADILDADVIAFQEVEKQAAAEHGVDPANYQIFISDRSHTQRTGFAVRKSIAEVQNSAFSALSLLAPAGLQSLRATCRAPTSAFWNAELRQKSISAPLIGIPVWGGIGRCEMLASESCTGLQGRSLQPFGTAPGRSA